MKAKIFSVKEQRDIDVDFLVYTISVAKNDLDPLRVSMVHCWRCGNPTLQVQGDVVSIVPGGLPDDILKQKARLIDYCKFCKMRYIFSLD